MRNALTAVGIVAALSGCAPMQYSRALQDLNNTSINEVGIYASTVKDFLYAGHTEDEAIDAGKRSVIAVLKDGESARFRNVHLKPYLQGAVVCGEVNAKNSYGGYVGFTRFAAGISGAMLEDTSSRRSDINSASNAGIDVACR
ncbi:hypothetical protein [Delftia sp. HK171]|uniref:hypothetical protein n=1 Tax=Delftia sp. HK171 TaxID=1920191 RepID=UPI00114E87E3|nr:hypothetical protein [Delftia sp. HK171]TQL83105.1 hypothetical protein FB549_0592 [Delftia sp. HK171]